LNNSEILDLHRTIVSVPSASGSERALADLLQRWMEERDWPVTRTGDSLLTTAGSGPVLFFDTHLDTVPADASWKRHPHRPEVEEGRVYGLGANDAKASVAAMLAAFARLRREELAIGLALGLAAEEETKGRGSEMILGELGCQGIEIAAAVVGEPTGLEIAIAQKGLLILELVARGDACHAANAARLGARNAVFELARDLSTLETLELAPRHAFLGETSLQPTVIQSGTARNMLPGAASVILDLRTTPAAKHDDLIDLVRRSVHGEVRVVSQRLEPRETLEGEPIVRAALAARPESRVFGSATMSDLVFLRSVPAIKVGPGRSERSHTPDEFVLESEILEGAQFYRDLALRYAELTRGSGERSPQSFQS